MRLTTGRAETAEPSQTSRIAPGEFILKRSGEAKEQLVVYLEYEGTATPEKDYARIEQWVTFPPGAAEAKLLVQPFDDLLVEGDETVVAHLMIPPTDGLPTYHVDSLASAAKVVIHDNDSIDQARVKITHPTDGSELAAGVDVEINAVAMDPASYISQLEFYLDDALLDVSIITFIRAPDPGSPIYHSVLWKNPAPGEHLLTARGKDSRGIIISSEPVTVTVGKGSAGATVSILAVDPEGTELPPFFSSIEPIQFQIYRTGSTSDPMTVFFSLHGTASPGVDYFEVSNSLVIPEGQSSAKLQIVPKSDLLDVVEPMETVGVRLEPSPVASLLPSYRIDPLLAEAGGVIYEQKAPANDTLELVFPSRGEGFELGQPITVMAAHSQPEAFLQHVEFYDREKKIGESSLIVDLAPGDIPTLMFHRFVWKEASVGEHILTARTTLANGTQVVSSRILIVVKDSGVSRAYIKMTTPEDGETFPEGAPIPLTSVAVDPNGYIPRVEFYANDRRVGVSEIAFIQAPDPGTPITHTFLWEKAPAGEYVLSARGVDAAGRAVISQRVKIVVGAGGGDDRVVLSVEAIDPVAYEPWENSVPDSAVFVIKRIAGRKDVEVLVSFELSGGAVNGVDYSELKESAGIPAGQESVEIVIKAIPDKAIEGEEVVELALREIACPAIFPTPPQCYQIGKPGSARAVIREKDSRTAEARIEIITPKTGEVFRAGADVSISAVAVDPRGYISRVEFYANERLLGVSEIVFIRAPDPGTPITHSRIWENVPAGEYALTARSIDATGNKIISPTVKISVNGDGDLRPKVAIVRPRDGTVIRVGEKIEVRAESGEADGEILRLDILEDGQLLDSTKLPSLTVVWSADEPGAHTFTARALDTSGVSTDSAPIRILVEHEEELTSFVERELPGSYSPGVALTVRLVVKPVAGTLAYAVEDVPPKGWKVSDASHEGGFDAVTGKVKFGPFTDAEGRTLEYQLTPPENASGRYEFGGSSSAGGTAFPIAGDRLIQPGSKTHPADLDLNHKLSLTELTGYAAAWKSGQRWSLAPNPIPLTHVARAGVLWRQGEAYHYDSNLPDPLCFVTDRTRPPAAAASTGEASVFRAVGKSEDGINQECNVTITPRAGTMAYAVEEKMPLGWKAINLSDSGAFDEATGTIRWGAFTDGLKRTLHYSLLGPAKLEAISQIQGSVSFDGGKPTRIGNDRPRLPHVAREKDGAVRLTLEGSEGQVCVLESTIDLVTWKQENALFLPNGQLNYKDENAGGVRQRYYRLRTR